MHRLLKKAPAGLRKTLLRCNALPIWRHIYFSTLRSVRPLSPVFGYERGGTRVGRFYIEKFLQKNKHNIRGRVLEVADNAYTVQFGEGRVTQSEILHARPGNPAATIVGDLQTGEGIDSEGFDCIILTQTLQSIFDVRACVGVLYRILRPGGVLLMTGNGISQISKYDMERWGDYWRFTTASVRRLFEEKFPADCIEVESYGNVLTAFAVLQGMNVEELRVGEIEYTDPNYQVIVVAKVQRPFNSVS